MMGEKGGGGLGGGEMEGWMKRKGTDGGGMGRRKVGKDTGRIREGGGGKAGKGWGEERKKWSGGRMRELTI